MVPSPIATFSSSTVSPSSSNFVCLQVGLLANYWGYDGPFVCPKTFELESLILCLNWHRKALRHHHQLAPPALPTYPSYTNLPSQFTTCTPPLPFVMYIMLFAFISQCGVYIPLAYSTYTHVINTVK